MRLLHTLMKKTGMDSSTGKKEMKQKKEIDLKQIVKDLNIDRPIMDWRVVGSRIEIHLTGGGVLYWPEEPADKEHPDPPKEAPKKKRVKSTRDKK